MSVRAVGRGGRHAALSLGLLVVVGAASAALVGEDLDNGLTQAHSLSQPGRAVGTPSAWLDRALTGSSDGDAQQLDVLLDLPVGGPLLTSTPASGASRRNLLIPQAVAQATAFSSDSGPAVLAAAPTTTQMAKRGWTSTGELTPVQRSNGLSLPERDRDAGAPGGGEAGMPLRDKLRLTVGFVRDNSVWLAVLLAALGVLAMALKAYSRRI